MRYVVQGFWARYKGEIIIAISVGAVSFVGTTIVTLLIQRRDPLMVVVVALAFVVTTLLLVLLFNLKRIVDSRFGRVDSMLFDLFGISWRESQYVQRLRHYHDEKELLARKLVNEVLPRLASKAQKECPQLTRLNLILDSGTTITPVFPHLLVRGVAGFPKEKLRIYTNNLAGIGEIHRSDDVQYAVLSERDFVLVAGQPLSKYRATTGRDTEAFLETIWDKRQEGFETTVTVAVLAANWLLGGLGLDQLSFCARGEGHFEFKRIVFEHSDYAVLVAPLGKILHRDDVAWLNGIIPQQPAEKYRDYRIPDKRRDKTYLLTSLRPDHTCSPLKHHSMHLDDIRKQKRAKNYTFWDPVEYNPRGSTAEVKEIEVPHQYLSDHLDEAY